MYFNYLNVLQRSVSFIIFCTSFIARKMKLPIGYNWIENTRIPSRGIRVYYITSVLMTNSLTVYYIIILK